MGDRARTAVAGQGAGDSGLQRTLAARHVSRRAFLGYCAMLASWLGLAPGSAGGIAAALAGARRASVIWLSFQECTGCTESLTRSPAPDIGRLILEHLSLDYHHTLQAASGDAAEAARRAAMARNPGRYIVVVDGSIPTRFGGACSTSGGMSNVELLRETAAGAAAVIAVGSCAAYGGLPAAAPNPTGAVPVSALLRDKPLINVPGCPPLPEAMVGVLAHFLAYGRLPAVDEIGRPRAFYADTIHDRCNRRGFFDRELFAERFDDDGARQGWCLLKLGCRGPTTHNACATIRWNGAASSPIESGHGCLGCSEPGFWDAGSFYEARLPAKSAGGNGDTPVARGGTLWQETCSYCHGQQPAALRTAAEQVPAVLRQQSIRAHRFGLGEADLRDLAQFLKSEVKRK